MNKNNYFAIQAVENDRNYSYVMKIHSCENVKSKLSDDRIKFVHLCNTKKQAEELSRFWNQCFIDNGTSYFDKVYPVYVA